MYKMYEIRRAHAGNVPFLLFSATKWHILQKTIKIIHVLYSFLCVCRRFCCEGNHMTVLPLGMK